MNATTTNQPHSKTITKATTKTIPPAFVLWSAGLLIVVICILLLCAVPPVSRDALTHHLYIPKLYIQHGAIYEIPEVDFSYFPMNVDLLYLLSLYLGNDIVPKFIHFIFALATSGLIFLYIKKHLTYTWACFGALFFLSTPIVVKLSTTAYVDLGLIFFSTLSLLFILRWADKPIKKKNLLWAGGFCGLALGTKYNGLLTLVILSLFIPILFQRGQIAQKQSNLKALGYCLLFICTALLLFSPWGVRNILWTGNPFYPLFGSVFGTGDTAVMGGFGPFVTRKLLYHESLPQILSIPIRIFFEGQDNNPQFFDGKLNPFLLILPFFAFLSSFNQKTLRRESIVLASFALLYLWIVFFQRDIRIRYIGPSIPPLVILSVFGLKNLFAIVLKRPIVQTVFRFSLFFAISTALFINFSYLYNQFSIIQPLSYLSGQVTRSDYLSKYRPEYPVIEYANNHLVKNSKILCVFLGNRGYYFDINHIFDLRNGSSILCNITKESRTPSQLLRKLHELNITHIIIRYDLWKSWTSQYLTPDEITRYSQFQNNYTKGLYYYGSHVLFAIQPENTSITQPLTQKQQWPIQ